MYSILFYCLVYDTVMYSTAGGIYILYYYPNLPNQPNLLSKGKLTFHLSYLCFC